MAAKLHFIKGLIDIDVHIHVGIMAQGWASYPTQGATNGQPMSTGLAENLGAPVELGPPAKAKVGHGKRLRLETGAQIRRELTRTIRAMKANEIDLGKASKIVWALDILSRMLERQSVEELAARLDRVEGR